MFKCELDPEVGYTKCFNENWSVWRVLVNSKMSYFVKVGRTKEDLRTIRFGIVKPSYTSDKI